MTLTKHFHTPAVMALLLLASFSLCAATPENAFEADALAQASEDELWQDYYTARTEKNVERAHEVANWLLTRARELHGRDSLEFGQALAEVGVTQVLLERYGKALANLRQAEDILDRNAPLYSEKLLSALSFLGSALQKNGRHKEAINAFTRAQHLTHRLWGTKNKDQVPLAYAKAASHQAMGELYQAEQLHRYALSLYRSNYGEQSPEAIAASAKLGTWLRSTGDYHGSLYHFRMALAELHGKGPDVPESYPLLLGLAHAYRGGYRGRYARSTHQRILDLMEAQPEQFSLDQRIKAHLGFGDWLMQRYYERKAVKQYEAAWKLANEAGADGRSWMEEFSNPKLVRYGEMAPHDIVGANRYVKFKFDIKADGRARRVKVTEYECDGREQYIAKLVFPSQVRYRPAIVDGRAVARSDQTTTMYLLTEATPLEPASVEAPTWN